MLDIPDYIVELYEKGELEASKYARTHRVAQVLLDMRDRLFELYDGSAEADADNRGICAHLAWPSLRSS